MEMGLQISVSVSFSFSVSSCACDEGVHMWWYIWSPDMNKMESLFIHGVSDSDSHLPVQSKKTVIYTTHDIQEDTLHT